jgi:hypothetical protein
MMIGYDVDDRGAFSIASKSDIDDQNLLLATVPKVYSKNIWTVKIKIGVVRLVKSLVIFMLPGRYL